MRLPFLFLLFISRIANATIDTLPDNDYVSAGIRFENGTRWEQILAKAKRENKFIFVDCYTTWCLPCKKIEKEVYSMAKVGDIINRDFISYKLQMDTGKNDNAFIRSTYWDARYFEKVYKIFSFPTMLFFSPEGKILNKNIGVIDDHELVTIAENVTNPKKNYYKLLERFQNGERDMAAMSFLASAGIHIVNDTNTAMGVAKEYLRLLKREDWLTKENIEFMQEFTKSTRDAGFSFFVKNTARINEIMETEMYAENLVRPIVFYEMVRPELKLADSLIISPNWNQLIVKIKAKVNAYYADLTISATKVDYYRINKNWNEYSKSVVSYVEKYILPQKATGRWPAYTLNNFAWEIFKRSENQAELQKAISWSSKAIMMDPQANWMDTYANLLYKIGQSEVAIRWQAIASRLDPNDRDIQENYEKMKRSEPTWAKWSVN